MDKELKIAIARNLLEEKTCDICDRYAFCSIKLGRQYGTCRRWKKYQTPSFAIKSYSFTVKPRKLNISWTKSTELELEKMQEAQVNLLENNDYAVYKHLKEWSDKGALQTLSGKSCTTCSKADECKKKEMNEYGFCEEDYDYFDGSAESILVKEVTKIMKNQIDEEVKKCQP